MSIFHDSTFCIGCRACQQACQDYHNLPSGKKLMEITEKETFRDGVLTVKYIMNTCKQCRKAKCLEICPAKAIYRNVNGTVIINEENCIGCGKCEKSCPFGKIIIVKNKALKCMECYDRRGRTVCEEACPILCIHSKERGNE